MSNRLPPLRCSCLLQRGFACRAGENPGRPSRRSRCSAASPVRGIGRALQVLAVLAALLSPQAARAQNPGDLLKPPFDTTQPCTVVGNPIDASVCAGDTVQLAALYVAAGQPLSLKWQVSTDGQHWTDFTGGTQIPYISSDNTGYAASPSLSFTTSAGDPPNRWFRVQFSDATCGTQYSGAALVQVSSPLAIATHPSSQSAADGADVVFTAASSPPAAVQWQVSTNGGSFTNLAGETSTTLHVTASTATNGNRYQAVFTNACGSVPSTAATLTLSCSASSITTHPASQSVCLGQPVSFVAAAAGTSPLSVQWQVKRPADTMFANLNGATDPILTFTPTIGDTGNQYQAVFTNACGSATTSAASLTVNSAAVTAGGDRLLCAGESLILPRNGTPSGGTYKWTLPNGHFVSAAGTITISADVIQQGLYQLEYTVNGCIATDSMTVTVNSRPTAAVSGDATRCAGQSARLSVMLTGMAPWSLTWSDGAVQSGIMTSPATRDVSPASTTTYSVTAVSGEHCTGSSSGAATVTVNLPPTITPPNVPTLNADAGQCSATVAAFSPGVTGTPTPAVSYSIAGQPIKLPYAFPVGATQVTATASNGCSPDATCSFTVNVVDTQKPTLSGCPTDQSLTVTCLPGGLFGAIPSFNSPTAADNCGAVNLTCTAPLGAGGAGVPVTSGVTGFPAGSTKVTYTATDLTGNSTTCSFNVGVAYQWSGILQPVNADGSSVFKAGSTVPVKFALTGPSACITTIAATLSYSLVSLGENAPVNEAVSTSAATTGNLFRYTGGQYLFNWSTKGLAAGQYELHIDLGDGVPHIVRLGLK